MTGEVIDKVVGYLAKPTEIAHPNAERTVKHVVVPLGGSVHVIGDPYGRRLHTFADLQSFARWLQKAVAEHPDLEALVGATEAVASLDPRDPMADELRCQLVETPELAAWKAALGKPLDQRALYLLILGVAATIETPASDVLLQAIGTLRVLGESEMHAELDERGVYRVRGKTAQREVATTIPSVIAARVPIYRGLVDAAGEPWGAPLKLQLTIDVEEPTEPTFTLMCPDLDVQMEAARRAVAEQVGRAVPDRLVGLGAWKTEMRIAGVK